MKRTNTINASVFSISTHLKSSHSVHDRIQITITAEKNNNDAVVAPIQKGQVMGTLELKLDGETLWTTNLVASQNIELSQFEYTMRMINSIFDKWWFRLCVLGLALLIIADVVLNAVQKARIAKLEARRTRKANIRAKW